MLPLELPHQLTQIIICEHLLLEGVCDAPATADMYLVIVMSVVDLGVGEEVQRGLVVHEVRHVTREVKAVHQVVVVPGLQEVVLRYVVIVRLDAIMRRLR